LPFLTVSNLTSYLEEGKNYFRGVDLGWIEAIGGQGGIWWIIKISASTDK